MLTNLYLVLTMSQEPSTAGFLNLSTTDMWGQITVCCRAVLRATRCPAASLASPHRTTVATPPHITDSDNHKCL